MKVAALSYATSQGLSHLLKAFYDHGLVTHPIIMRHPASRREPNMHWYPRGTPVVSGPRHRSWGRALEVISSADVFLAFETFFDWSIIDFCRRRNTKTVLMPMYEWTPARMSHKPDLMLCPSLLDRDYLGGEFLTVPVDPSHWKLRTRADRFLHNAGNVGCREHKGTRQLLEAIPLVQNPDFRITVRAQDERALRSIVQGCPAAESDPRCKIEYGEIPYEKLWDDHDVLIAPEKQNGLSLPLQEGWAAGMAVMTTDRYPMNAWLPKELLIPVERYEKAHNGGCIEFDSAVVNPRDIAATIDAWIGKDISQFSLAGKAWADTNSWPVLLPRYREILEGLLR